MHRSKVGEVQWQDSRAAVSSLAIVGSNPTWPPFACEVGRRDLITLLGVAVAAGPLAAP
jgi:hypothetical protein